MLLGSRKDQRMFLNMWNVPVAQTLTLGTMFLNISDILHCSSVKGLKRNIVACQSSFHWNEQMFRIKFRKND